MRILYLYCHPLPESFHAAIRDAGVAALRAAGHEVDLCDLYAEGFEPILTAEMRREYHDTALNRKGIEAYVERLHRAEALVVQFPTWCFGFPAMLKGFFDRLFSPGITFDLSDPANVKPMLGHIRHVIGISTYGRIVGGPLWLGSTAQDGHPLSALVRLPPRPHPLSRALSYEYRYRTGAPGVYCPCRGRTRQPDLRHHDRSFPPQDPLFDLTARDFCRTRYGPDRRGAAHSRR